MRLIHYEIEVQWTFYRKNTLNSLKNRFLMNILQKLFKILGLRCVTLTFYEANNPFY